MSPWERFIIWLDEHKPEWCGSCNKFLWSKDARYRKMLVYPFAIVPLCKECYKLIFEPNSEVDQKEKRS